MAWRQPARWPDGSYSVQGAAAALGITAQTVFKWLRKGRLLGHQRIKGQPWQITLPDDSIGMLAAQVRRTSHSGQGVVKRSGSEHLTGALLDRLTHHVHILSMNGESSA